MLLYAVTIFVSAFLLFLVQPVIAKQILPWFGGSAAVWTTCLVFFQIDAAARLCVRRLDRAASSRRARRCSCTWRCWSLSLARAADHARRALEARRRREPVLADPRHARRHDRPPVLPAVDDEPAGAGLVRAALSGASPYRLFALSNLASMLALLGYPFLLEPWVATRAQALGWSAGYVLFVGLCAAAGWRSLQRRRCRRARRRHDGHAASPAPLAPTARRPSRASCCGARSRRRRRSCCSPCQQPHHAEHRVGAAAVDRAARALPADLHPLLRRQGLVPARHLPRRCSRPRSASWRGRSPTRRSRTSSTIQVGVFCVGLFLACMFCHGELVRLKPAPRVS